MPYENTLSKYRLEQAEQCIKSAKILFLTDDYKGAANRSYYCVFHCMRSVLALEHADYKSHSAIISHFRREYVKTGKFEVKLSDILGGLFQARNDSDYEDDFDYSKEDIEEQIANAEYFLEQVREYLRND
ncbi:MAG: HEPN domain-containing protein [Clostridiales bacterium]|nr:HEPN domain-containing protein [Clostridiales bacterium]